MEMHGAKTPPAEEEATVKANYRWVQESKLIAYQSDDGYHGPVSCMRCKDLEEPPWWPNNRDRCHEMLLRNLQPPAFAEVDSTSILRLIAEYLAENRP